MYQWLSQRKVNDFAHGMWNIWLLFDSTRSVYNQLTKLMYGLSIFGLDVIKSIAMRKFCLVSQWRPESNANETSLVKHTVTNKEMSTIFST